MIKLKQPTLSSNLGTNEVTLKSPSSKYSSKSTHISAKLHSSNKRKHLSDLDKSSSKIENKPMTAQNNPKTMSSLTTRYIKTNPSPCNKPFLKSTINKRVTNRLLNDSNDTLNHSSNKTDSKNTRKLSPMNVSAIIKETSKINVNGSNKNRHAIMNSNSFSRNKMLKNKTLPNLFNYGSKMSNGVNISTRAITKQFMNPNKKYLSKQRNKTFIEPKTPSEGSEVIKNRVYESGSTSRSGGTGEPNYSDFKNKFAYRKFNNNMYENKIKNLAKENSQFKNECQKLK